MTSPPLAATDSLGCTASRLHDSHELTGPGTRFHRKRSQGAAPGQVATLASDRGHLVGVSMVEGHRRRIFRGGQATSHDFDGGSVYVRDFADDYRAELSGAFDFMLFEISRDAFEQAADERPGPRVRGLACVTAMDDPVLSHLALAMLPALQRPHEASALFVDQMSSVIATCLMDRYGGAVGTARERSGRLSRLHETRAKDLLLSRLDGGVSIAEVAQACRLSRSHFIRAFRETTGHTPHRWLSMQRIEKARALLMEASAPLADIASACGFADQSHFTRVFAQGAGMPPGQWRRQFGR